MTLPPRVLFGAAYYLEYQREPALKADLDLMVEAGFSVIRVGESVWSTWEPRDGELDLDWLAPVLDEAHARGLHVVLGTPTYAVPMWLVRKHPEIAAQLRTGQPMGWGARQEVDFTHPAFRFHAERVIRAIVERYAAHPAVIGWQVDNEPGLHLFHNEGVFQRFVDELRREHGSVDALNEAWGLTYWSHRLSEWADLWRPDGNAQPQYALAWQRFQARLTTEFIAWQAGVVREVAGRAGRDDQFVTTCIAYARPAVQDVELTAGLDVTAGNPYYRVQDHLALPDDGPGRKAWLTQGLWAVRQSADRMWASRQEPYLITETNAGGIFGAGLNEVPWDGQLRQLAWQFVARGARMVEYWHWNTLAAGAETYWGGVLPHSGEPGRVYAQVAQLGAELATAGALVAELVPDADVSFVSSHSSRWSQEIATGYVDPLIPIDPLTWDAAFDALYRGVFDAGGQGRIIHASQLLALTAAEAVAAHPVLVAAGLVAEPDALLIWLGDYAAAGGHLVLGVRTGYEDEQARARPQRKPALLDEAAGVWYEEVNTLSAPLPVVIGGDGAAAAGVPALDLPDDAHAVLWVDGLTPHPGGGAQVLAGYDHPHFSRFPAAVTRAHGDGRVTTLGAVPGASLARAVGAWLLAGRDAADDAAGGAGGSAAWRPQRGTGADAAHAAVTTSGATAADGSRLRFVHHWAWGRTAFAVPVAVTDVLSGERLEAGSVLDLGPWDARVLREDATATGGAA